MPNIYDNPEQITTVVNPAGNIIVDNNIPDYVTPLDVDLLKFKPILPPIDYSNLDFSSIKLQLLNFLGTNAGKFGYNIRDFGDSNTAGMMMNLMAHMGQMLSYHMDSMVNELFLDTAQSSWSTQRLLNMFKYKPARPKSGLLMMNIVRRAATSINSTTASYENNSQITLSSALARRQIVISDEVFELFPVKINSLGIMEPDYLSDLIIPPYVSIDPNDPDAAIMEEGLNTYTCFALTGLTKIEDFKSNGTANQIISLASSPITDSNIIVQVQDTSISIPGKTVYNTWTEIPYISLAGFASPALIQATAREVPYLITPIKLSETAIEAKNNGTLVPGTLMEINYDNVASIAKYTDFLPLTVPFRLGMVSALTSESKPDSTYVDLLIYHPSYTYGNYANNTSSSYNTLETTFLDPFNVSVPWSTGDILYLLDYKSLYIPGIGEVKQPQMISDTQLMTADPAKYPDVAYLLANPDRKIAVGRVIDSTTIALGLSADIESTYYSEPVYEVTWDGNFAGQVRFGNGVFGRIPEKDAAIKIIYRTNDSGKTGYTVGINEANQNLNYRTVVLELSNSLSSSPSTAGENLETSKELVTRFYSSQDRAVTGDDYLLLAKRFNAGYKLAVALTKAEADASVIRLYALSTTNVVGVAPLSTTEKYQLRNYLNQYRPIGTAIEIVDGTIRSLDIRIDARVKSGYLTGQVKQDLITTATQFFNVKNTDLGLGLRASDFIKSISSVSGIRSVDVYLGGLSTVFLPDGTEIITGEKTYSQLKDIPAYQDTSEQFPSLATSYNVSLSLSEPVAPYEIVVLSNLTVNVLTV
jgi:hypothetical protein